MSNEKEAVHIALGGEVIGWDPSLEGGRVRSMDAGNIWKKTDHEL